MTISNFEFIALSKCGLVSTAGETVVRKIYSHETRDSFNRWLSDTSLPDKARPTPSALVEIQQETCFVFFDLYEVAFTFPEL